MLPDSQANEPNAITVIKLSLHKYVQTVQKVTIKQNNTFDSEWK